MHEFSLATDLLNVARDEARRHNLVSIDRIIVRVGTLSGVCIEPLEFAFGFLREEDPMTENAEMVIETIQGRGKCTSCGGDIELEHLFLYCPDCKTPTVEITAGKEFLIVSIEGEEAKAESSAET